MSLKLFQYKRHTENKEQDTTNKPKVNNVARVPVNASFLLIS